MSKKRPAEFPTDWHYEEHLQALQRELAGRKNRLAELEAMGDDAEAAIEETKGEIDAVEGELRRYGVIKATRPAKPAESRGKK